MATSDTPPPRNSHPELQSGPPPGALTAGDVAPSAGLWNCQPRVRGCLSSISAEAKRRVREQFGTRPGGRIESVFGEK